MTRGEDGRPATAARNGSAAMNGLWTRLTAPGRAGGLSAPGWAALAVISLAVLLPGFATVPVMDRDEARYAQASKQMLETGDFIDIRFQEEARHVKPVGVYWMQAASAALVGGADAPIWAYRVPSLLGVLIAAFATAWLGARVAGPGVGLAAGIILALTLAVAVEARTAKTDAALLGAAALAQTALFVLFTAPPGAARPRFWGAPALFWAASGAAILIKGPIVTMVSAVTIAAYALWRRDLSLLTRLRVGWGLALLLAIITPWLAAITIKTGGAFLEESVGHALMGKVAEGDDSHGGPPGYHTLLSVVTVWPATLLLGLAALTAWRGRAEPTVQFLIAWIVPTWLIFELVATKLPHYVLPTFPAIAVLAAIAIRDAASLRASVAGRALHWGSFVAFAIVAAALAAAPVVVAAQGGEIGPANLLAIAAAVIVLAAGLAFALKPQGSRLLMLAAATWLMYGAVFDVAVPRLDVLWPSDRIAREVRSLEGCEEIAAATAGYREPSNVFLLGTPTVLAVTGEEAGQFLLDHPACGVAAVDAAARPGFDAVLSEAGVAPRSVGAVRGVNTVKGDDLALELLVHAQSQLTARP